MSRIFKLALEDYLPSGPWAELEACLGFALPEDLKEWICEDKLHLDDYRFFTPEEIYDRYVKCRAEWDSGMRIRMLTQAGPEVNRSVWNPKWVEIAVKITDEFPEYPNPDRPTLAVDFDPAEAGEAGQVIRCGHTTSRHRITNHYQNLV